MCVLDRLKETEKKKEKMKKERDKDCIEDTEE